MEHETVENKNPKKFITYQTKQREYFLAGSADEVGYLCFRTFDGTESNSFIIGKDTLDDEAKEALEYLKTEHQKAQK